MRQLLTLPSDLLTYLDEYQKWIIANPPDKHLPNWKCKGKFLNEGLPEYAASWECMKSTPAKDHDGYPPDSYGYDLNENSMDQQMANNSKLTQDEKEWVKKYKEKSRWIDDVIGNWAGFKFCALKMYYPKDGYIAWHTNWNVPGFNCLFTWSDGSGYWRNLDPTHQKPGSLRADECDSMGIPRYGVHIQDKEGWHCKLGYYGEKSEHDKIMWHAAFGGPRITLGFVVKDPAVWDDIVDELTDI